MMVLFDDLAPVNKLLAYGHKIDWVDGQPVPRPENAVPIAFEAREPLREECRHFIECVGSRNTPRTDGEKGLKVLKILEDCESYLRKE
jgi:UDP-2-acetamido-3-amino-2,3-dideoxy-glucuronate N-acetyltransferase